MKNTDGFYGMLFGLDLAKEDKIICLVGASGSGKTTISKELEKLGYNIIFSYTTREPREEGEWGHIFIKDDGFTYDFDGLVGQIGGIATRNYGHPIALKEIYRKMYFATIGQYQGKGTSIYIVDPEGAEMVKENVKDAEVITIFIMTDELVRYQRIRDRHYKSKRYDEDIDRDELHEDSCTMAVTRIRKDREIFKTCKCDYAVDANREVEEVLKDLVEIIC